MTRKSKHLTGQNFIRQASGAIAKLAARTPRKTRRTSGATKPILESLEGRQLMSSVELVEGLGLWVYGDRDAANLVTVRPTDDGETLAVNVNGDVSQYAMDAVKSVRIRGGGEKDVIYVDGEVDKPLHIKSGDNKDRVYAPERGRRGDDSDRVEMPSEGERAVAALERQARVAGLKVTGFSLINAVTNEVIADFESLGDGVTLNLATLPTRHINIRANVEGDMGGSVMFSFNGSTRVENASPYAMRSDTRGDYFNWTPKTGTYTITATPFTRDRARGETGQAMTVTLKFVNEPVTNPGNNGGGDIDGGGSEDAPPRPQPQPQPQPEPEPNPNPDGGDEDNNDAASPEAVIDAISTSIEAGHAIHVNALQSLLKSGDLLGARFEWDFGDAGSKYNTLVGFNAAHLYDRAGTYTVTLTVTNAAGKTDVARTSVTVKSSTRRVIYVSQDGNDWNTGFSPEDPIKSIERVRSMAGDDTEIRFRRGDEWGVSERIRLGGDNVVIGAYGTGERPVLRWVASIKHSSIISTHGTDATIRDLRLDSTADDARGLYAVTVGGANTSVVGVELGTMGYGLMNTSATHGVLAQDNVAVERLRSYFSWAVGTDHVYLGNKVDAPTDRTHVIRAGGAKRLLIAYNDFKKLANDPGVTIRGTLTLNVAEHVYVVGNTLTNGKVTAGPIELFEEDGDPRYAEQRTKWVVIEGNQISSQIVVRHGTDHIMLRDNVINVDRRMGIEISGYKSLFERGVDNIYILNNTMINTDDQGNFLRVWKDASGITMTGNLYLAPNMEMGSAYTAVIKVEDNNLDAFREISGNIWPDAEDGNGSDGECTMFFVGTDLQTGQTLTPAEWHADDAVGTDMYDDVTLSDRYCVTVGQVTAGSSLRRAA